MGPNQDKRGKGGAASGGRDNNIRSLRIGRVPTKIEIGRTDSTNEIKRNPSLIRFIGTTERGIRVSAASPMHPESDLAV